MTARILLSLLPAILLIALLASALTGRWIGVLAGFAMFAITLALGVWAIQLSHESKAWALYFFIPTTAGAAGLLALGWALSRGAKGWPVVWGGRLALLAALSIPAAHFVMTWRRNAEIARSAAEIAEHDRQLIARRARLNALEAEELAARQARSATDSANSTRHRE